MNTEIYSDRLKEASARAGFSISWYGRIGETGLPVLERSAGTDAPLVYVASGVHGDEPAGPMAVLDLLRRKALPEGFNYAIFPMVNPVGLAAGTRTNGDGIDLNRDYGREPASEETRCQLEWIGDRKLDLVLCLHEDDEGTGFYIYELLRAPTRHDYAGLAIEAARPWTGIEKRTVVDEMPSEKGRMFPPEAARARNRPDLPEALRLYYDNAPAFTFTTETPSCQLLTDRVRAQCAVVEGILSAFSTEDHPLPSG